jgi:hypothetical protein
MTSETGERSITLFLDLLDRSIASSTCAPIPLSMKREIKGLTETVAVDLEAPIEGEVAI